MKTPSENDFWKSLKFTQKADLWFAKHHSISRFISIFIIAVAVALPPLFIEYFDAFIYVCWVIIACSISIIISTSCVRLMARPLTQLSSANPYPLLYVTQKLLSFKSNNFTREIVTLNHAAALRCAGKYEEAYETLKSYVIESKSTTNQNKIVYYNNMADICALLGKKDEFYRNFETAFNIATASKSEKEKRHFGRLSLHLYMQKAMLENQHDEVIRLSDMYFSSQSRDASTDTDVALLRALSLMGKGDPENAKPYLKSIIQYGGALHNVTIAKHYLDTLTE